jgi:hypothetical protein
MTTDTNMTIDSAPLIEGDEMLLKTMIIMSSEQQDQDNINHRKYLQHSFDNMCFLRRHKGILI